MAERVALVTGARGFLGRYVVAALEEAGRRVVALGLPSADPQLDVSCDLTASVPQIAPRSVQEVYHLAGLAHVVPRDAAMARRFFEVNVGGTQNLLAALERAGGLPEALVLVSTVAVYGRERGEELDESTPRNAKDPYGRSKLQAEDEVLEWSRRTGVRVGIVRLPLVAGRCPPGNLGAMIRALRSRWYMGIGDGVARRSVVLAEDVAAVLPRVAEAGGIYHLTDGAHPSVRELEEGVARALGRRPPPRLPLPFARFAGWAGDLGELVLRRPLPVSSRVVGKLTTTLTFSDRRARRELGWAPRAVLSAVDRWVGQ